MHFGHSSQNNEQIHTTKVETSIEHSAENHSNPKTNQQT